MVLKWSERGIFECPIRDRERNANVRKRIISPAQLINRRAKLGQECPGLQTLFAKHFNHVTERDTPIEISTHVPECIRKLRQIPIDPKKLHNDPPELAELKRAISRLRNGKAWTDVPAEYLKVATEEGGKRSTFGPILD